MKGISLHLGLNEVLESSYKADPLDGCHNDAGAMAGIALSHNFLKRDILLDSDATFEKVVARIGEAAVALDAGDIFLFTFAGHGSQLGDEDGDEPDARDETLVLWDFMLSDDVIQRCLWPRFKAGVRIVMVSDSCHSGSVFHKMEFPDALSASEYRTEGLRVQTTTRSVSRTRRTRVLTEEARLEHIAANRKFYEALQARLPPEGDISKPASILLLAACADDETTPDGDPHGLFTQSLLNVLSMNDPSLDYESLLNGIANELALAGRVQHPLLTSAGTPNPGFLKQKPFSI